MNPPSSSSDQSLGNASRDEMLAALFANMVVQHTNMALIFLGRVPHPETGEHVFDLETAQMFIDQLEMLEAKTRGNLSKQEEGLLKQGLTATRMAFVEGAERGGKGQRQPVAQSQPPSPVPPAESPAPARSVEAKPAPEPSLAAPAADAESRKKFTKKY